MAGDPQLRVGRERGRRNWRGKHVARSGDIPTGGGFAARAGSGCCVGAANGWNVPTRISTPPAGYDLRGHRNILKRVLLQVCGLNLGLVTGFGTPRGLQGRADALGDALLLALRRFWGLVSRPAALMPGNWASSRRLTP